MTFTYILGGKGNMSGRKDINGGGYNPALRTWDEAQGANGVTLCLSVNPPATQGAANNGEFFVRLTGGSGDFTGALVGVLAWVDFSATYIDGHYEVMGTNDDTWIDIDLVYSSNAATERAFVGGAYGEANGDTDVHLQWGLDILNEGDTLKIRDSMTFNLNTVTVDCDGNDGIESARITVEAVDTDGVRTVVGDTKPVIQPFGNIAGALIEISNTTLYWDWHGLDFNGTSGEYTAKRGLFCNEGASESHRIFNCKFHDATSEGLWTIGHLWSMFNSECYNSQTKDGCYWYGNYSEINGCSFHDNARHGAQFNPAYSVITNNLAYSNDNIGIVIAVNLKYSTISNNVSFDNTGDGFDISSTPGGIRYYNNVSVNNGGYGYNLNSDVTHFAYFGYNHSYGNDIHANDVGGDVTSDADWAALGQGNNVTGDPKFTDITGFLTSLDHTGPEYTVTDSLGPFYAGMVGKTLRITSTGNTGNFVIGSYTIASFTSATEIALTTDPTNGSDDGAASFTFLDNFTPKYGSALLGVGFPASFEGGVDDRYTNYAVIGAVSPELLKATLGRGFNRGIA